MTGRQVAALVARKGVEAAGADAGRRGAVSRRAGVHLRAAAAVPIAIASGALRHEIDEIIDAAGLAALFATIVASGDTPESKPSPAPYRLAFERLQREGRRHARPAPLRRDRGLALGARVGARRRAALRRRHQQLSRARARRRRARGRARRPDAGRLDRLCNGLRKPSRIRSVMVPLCRSPADAA